MAIIIHFPNNVVVQVGVESSAPESERINPDTKTTPIIEKPPHPSAPDSWSVYVDGTLRQTAQRELTREEVELQAREQFPLGGRIWICDHRL